MRKINICLLILSLTFSSCGVLPPNTPAYFWVSLTAHKLNIFRKHRGKVPQGRNAIALYKEVTNTRGAGKLRRSLKKFHVPSHVDRLFHKSNGLQRHGFYTCSPVSKDSTEVQFLLTPLWRQHVLKTMSISSFDSMRCLCFLNLYLWTLKTVLQS